MKICMIGDSHLAMMINAQRQDPIDGLDITPVSWPRQWFDQVAFEGTEICANGAELAEDWDRCGLPARLDLSTFDKVVFVSYTITAFHAFVILGDHAVSGWNDASFLVKKLNSQLKGPGKRRLITPAVFRESLAGLIRENHTFGFVDHLRQHCDVPIVVIPAPYLAEHTLDHRKNLWGLKQVLRKRDGAVMVDALHDAHQMVFGSYSNLTLLRQPEESVVRGCLTSDVYRAGATRMGTGALHREDDILHAGPKLGRLYLQKISA